MGGKYIFTITGWQNRIKDSLPPIRQVALSSQVYNSPPVLDSSLPNPGLETDPHLQSRNHWPMVPALTLFDGQPDYRLLFDHNPQSSKNQGDDNET